RRRPFEYRSSISHRPDNGLRPPAVWESSDGRESEGQLSFDCVSSCLTTGHMFGIRELSLVNFMQSVILPEVFALTRSRAARARLESAFGERTPSPFTDLDRRVLESVPTGIAPLDALTGGLPRGAITEISGPPSSGRTSAMVSILIEAIADDEVCALVDGNDAFD